MKGLFNNPTIVQELLQCITPLEYMVLRRVFPIFLRKEKLYPSVNEFLGKGDVPDFGLRLLRRLYGEPPLPKPRFLGHHKINLCGARFTEKHGLIVRDIYTLIAGSFLVNTTEWARYLQSSNIETFLMEWQAYMDAGFGILIYHDPALIKDAIVKNKTIAVYQIRKQMGFINPKECVTTFECSCENYFSPRSRCTNNHSCNCKHHIIHKKVALDRWNEKNSTKIATKFNTDLARFIASVGTQKNMYQLIK